ncbi:hypothetical protein [Marinibacterium profundimaris]|uniref:Uncharacterized protein n=1 Tax=Marinibacterium profundimaris TaxID=1679460 RepID=A0A225NBB5_9RHOB|nr:hypothetical protein [Marinibacterium profundimaris]OWU67780.1 hypothetical protein ATO3_25450 [Marinibacterium profundimaris]
MSSPPTHAVRRRRVFYIPGYDPIPPRKYREIYRREGAEQAAVSGYELSIAPRSAGEGRYGWSVTGRMDGAEVQAEIDVLVWSDIVRASMSRSIPATYGQLARTAWSYIGSGAFFRLMRLRKGPMIAALYPVGMLMLYLAVAGLAGWAVGATLAGLAGGWGVALGWLPGLAVAALVLRGARALDGRTFVFYLMHDFAYSAQRDGAIPGPLSDRLAAFGDLVAGALAEEVDEVLVVGHSSGAHLAVTMLADLIREGRVPAEGPALALLSLGQVVPMVSFLPRADRLRGDLRYLSQREELTWVDVTAPGDGCAFALCDPVAVSGVAPGRKRWPLVVSAAFTQTLSPAQWAALRWRFHRLHFQYLHSFDRPGDYDYFRITAGPLTLADRYAGRAPSASRIETPISRYTSVAP